MKKNKENKIKNKEQRKFDKGQVFVKIMAGILAIMMIMSVAISLIYSLIQNFETIKQKVIIKEGGVWEQV